MTKEQPDGLLNGPVFWIPYGWGYTCQQMTLTSSSPGHCSKSNNEETQNVSVGKATGIDGTLIPVARSNSCLYSTKQFGQKSQISQLILEQNNLGRKAKFHSLY